MDESLLQQLRDVHLPTVPGWWPPAIGWWLLAIVVAGVLAWMIWWLGARWRRFRPARTARALYRGISQELRSGSISPTRYVHQTNELLKRFVLHEGQLHARGARSRLPAEAFLARGARSRSPAEAFLARGAPSRSPAEAFLARGDPSRSPAEAFLARGDPSRSPAEAFLARGDPSRSPAEGSFLRGAGPSRSPAEGSDHSIGSESGDGWLRYLDGRYGQAAFSRGPGRCLGTERFRRDVVVDAEALDGLINRFFARECARCWRWRLARILHQAA